MNWQRPLRSVSSALLFGVAASFLLQSWELGWLLTVSLLLHELGHIAQLQRYDIDWEMRFGLLGAATITPRDQRRALGCYQNAVIHLAGPLVNLAEALLALGAALVLSWRAADQAAVDWFRVCNFAALLGLVNLLPMGRISDGGKLAHTVFASLREAAEPGLLATLFFWLGSLVWLLAVSWGEPLRTFSTLIVGVWFVLGTLVASHQDDPAAAMDPSAMSRAQAFVLFGVMASGLLVSTALVVLTPFWLTPAHVEAIARNLARIAGLLGIGG